MGTIILPREERDTETDIVTECTITAIVIKVKLISSNGVQIQIVMVPHKKTIPLTQITAPLLKLTPIHSITMVRLVVRVHHHPAATSLLKVLLVGGGQWIMKVRTIPKAVIHLRAPYQGPNLSSVTHPIKTKTPRLNLRSRG